MKSIRGVFWEAFTYKKFLEAERRSSRNKRNRIEVILFEINLEKNLLLLMDSISRGNYVLSEYTSFIIKYPKIREIRKLPFVDRIVHQWYIEEFIKPYFVPRFIFDSYACLEGKGVLKAVRRVQFFLKKKGSCYVLKMDIHKYFDSINLEILLSILEESIKDGYLLNFTKKIIYNKANGNGLPIGNYTSQFFGNIYLDVLDQYIKRILKIKYYVRYLDDFIILVDNKQDAKDIYLLLKKFLEINLKLSLNPKSCYFPSKNGICFLGYKIYDEYLLIQRKFIRSIFKRRILSSKNISSYLGYLSHSASNKIVQYFTFKRG